MAFMAQHTGAVTLSPHGIGQALIYPYYTVNKNQDTLISVTNASDVGKAIQVRFREGMNGRDALSFVLFVAAHDTWTAALSAIEDEGVLMTTGDRSCTLSPVPSEGISFRTVAFDGTGVTPADGGPTGPQRTREGFFEMIVGGDVRPGSTTAAAITPRPNLYPPTCTIDEDTFPTIWRSRQAECTGPRQSSMSRAVPSTATTRMRSLASRTPCCSSRATLIRVPSFATS
jgi:hypothetical protein